MLPTSPVRPTNRDWANVGPKVSPWTTVGPISRWRWCWCKPSTSGLHALGNYRDALTEHKSAARLSDVGPANVPVRHVSVSSFPIESTRNTENRRVRISFIPFRFCIFLLLESSPLRRWTLSLSLSLEIGRKQWPFDLWNHEYLQICWRYDPFDQYSGPPPQNLRHQVMLR